MILLDGKKAAADWRADTARIVAAHKEASGLTPRLAAVLVGNDPASETYVNLKAKACAECGIRSKIVRMDADISQQELHDTVRRLNANSDIDGIIVQLPAS